MRILSLTAGLAIAVQVVAASGPQTLPASADSPLQITHRARAVAPGEVVLLDVRTQAALEDVQAQWMGQAVGFYKVEPGWWQGLAGIDLGASAGRQILAVRARTAGGRTLERAYPLTIAARTFPARRITVAPKFVDPPADELPRIESERKTVEAIFASPAHERFWSRPFIVPVPGTATSSFGRRTILNGEPRGQHTGTDFQAATGTPVGAPNRGRIALAADQYLRDGRSSSTTGSACIPTWPICRSSRSRKARWSSVVSGSVCPARQAGSPDRTCTGRCASAKRESIRCRW